MSARSKVPVVARTLLGLAFTVFGLNFFLHFLPQPPPPPELMTYVGALMSAKIMTIVKVVEVAAGLALLGGVFVPLALTLLAPIEIGILATHLAFEPSGLLIIAVLMALTLYLAWSYRSVFAPMLQARVEPTPATTPTSTHAASAAARA